MDKKSYGISNQKTKGILKTEGAFLKVPYSLLKADDFLDLDPLATKIYFIILRQWRTHKPDNPVEISFERIRELCIRNISGKRQKPSYSTIAKAIKQLTLYGFIHKETHHKVCNHYWIEQKWFTGEYK